jgi:hypothetical protein
MPIRSLNLLDFSIGASFRAGEEIHCLRALTRIAVRDVTSWG